MESSFPADAGGELRWHVAGVVFLLALTAVGAVDLALDGTADRVHAAVDGTLLALALLGAVALWAAAARARRALGAARAAAAAHRAERDAWRTRAEAVLRGLGTAIEEQLLAWRLTGAERETALLLLKGYGHKEIAALCGRSERTVRQHAVAVYRKSGLAGRAELAAFFLEDLLLPGAPLPSAAGDGG